MQNLRLEEGLKYHHSLQLNRHCTSNYHCHRHCPNPHRSLMAMRQNSRRLHAHINVLYTLPLVKREVFGPSHINFVLGSIRLIGCCCGRSCMNRVWFVDINIPLMLYISQFDLVMVGGWSTIHMEVVWLGVWLRVPTFTLEVRSSWWVVEAVHLTPIIPEKVDRGHVVGWGGWPTRHWGHGPFVMPYVLPCRVMPVA